MPHWSEDEHWLENRLQALGRARVAVFGDFCLDAYWLMDDEEDELSVETGLPVYRVRQQRYGLGGAGNIVANLAALGAGRIRAIGLIGDDLFGRQMRQLLADLNVDCEGILHCQADWQTQVYAKPYRGLEEQNRIDFGGFNVLADDTAEALAQQLDVAAAESDVVILNQQVAAGVSTPGMIEKINAVATSRQPCRFIVDSRHRADLYEGCLLKLNAHETARLVGEARPLDERIGALQARELALQLHQRTGKSVFVTRGENGLIVVDDATLTEIPGILPPEQVDPVGAGDTVVATVAAVLASGGEAVEAATLANIAAAVIVGKLQTTGTATPAEILQVGPVPDYVFAPELADDPRQASFVEGTEIEIVRPLPKRIRIRHAIFDHDGTVSTLREGWEGIMGPLMVRAILGPHYDDADEALYHKVVDTTRRFIDKTTGIRTLVQMQGLVEMVERFGCVSESDILDMHGYKAVYNEELLKMVHRRTAKIEAGELTQADYQMKNARELLEALHGRGVTLYLASGTDQADVIAEAEAMGYAHLFEGGIFGSMGDINVEAKRVVLHGIFRQRGLSGSEVAMFGDGPVEIRETRKRNGITVGVASDEVRRFGLNPAKRRRLILAGADLIVPDFSQMDRLLKVLQVDGSGRSAVTPAAR